MRSISWLKPGEFPPYATSFKKESYKIISGNMLKKIILIFLLLLLILPYSVNANRITLKQDFAKISIWDQIRYIDGDNMYINSYLKIIIPRSYFNYSNRYSFEFSSFEPSYFKEPIDYNITIYKNCDQVSLQYFLPTIVNCDDGVMLKEEDYIDTLKDQYTKNQDHEIILLHNTSTKEMTDYHILIQYKVENIVKTKGTSHYFSIEKRCRDYGNKDRCPIETSNTETVFLTNQNFILDKYPDNAKSRTSINGFPYLVLKGESEEHEIRYTDLRDDFRDKLDWAIIGAIIGAIFGLVIGKLPQANEKAKKKILNLLRVRL